MKYMLDTNFFDCLLRDKVIKSIIGTKHEFFITSIQFSELNAIQDDEKRTAIMEIIQELGVCVLPHSMCFSKLNFSRFSFENGEYIDPFMNDHSKHLNDALIVDAAIKNDLVVLSEDSRVIKRTRKIGGIALRYKEYINEFNI